MYAINFNKSTKNTKTYTITCNKCKKPNHFASVCRGSPASGVNGVADEADESFSQLSSIATKPL